jgi:hypothetical protein
VCSCRADSAGHIDRWTVITVDLPQVRDDRTSLRPHGKESMNVLPAGLELALLLLVGFAGLPRAGTVQSPDTAPARNLGAG